MPGRGPEAYRLGGKWLSAGCWQEKRKGKAFISRWDKKLSTLGRGGPNSGDQINFEDEHEEP